MTGSAGLPHDGAGHEALMRRALVLAAAAPRTGDVPIGAVVLDENGGELAAACNGREAMGDPTAHAEILALRAAAAVRGDWRLEGCTLVVTIEPCTMCAGAIGLARVARVVFGAWEPKTGAAGSLWDVLRDRRLTHRPEVVGGVLERECAEQLESFFAGRREASLVHIDAVAHGEREQSVVVSLSDGTDPPDATPPVDLRASSCDHPVG